MKKHAEKNEIWDRNQIGICQDVLGTVDQLPIDNCIVEEVRIHKRNLAIACYDYRKAYDMVHHDWMLRIYDWMGRPKSVHRVIERLIMKWKTRSILPRKKVGSRWIDVKRGFLQGSKWYKMGLPGCRELIGTHSLFLDNL